MVAAHLHGLLVLSWRAGAGLDHVQKVRALQNRLVANGITPLCVVNVLSLEAKAGISEELRRDGRLLYEQMLPHYFAQAYVVMGEGFWAAGIRAFLAAFTGLTAQRVQTRTFGEVGEAMTWLSELEGQQPWLREQVKERAQQIEDVVLGAHFVTAGSPSSRAFAPTKPQRIIDLGIDDSSEGGGPWTTACGPVHVSYWSESATVVDVDRMQGDVAMLVRETGNPVVLLMFVAPGTPLAPSETRARASVLVRELHDVIEGVAIVSSGSGLWAMALRGMFRGIELMMPMKVPWRIFGRVPPALRWLRKLDREGQAMPDSQEIMQAIDSLRAQAEALSEAEPQAEPQSDPQPDP